MHDLDLLSTRFARIVLSVAVTEDIVLYVVLAIAIGLVQTPGSAAFGVPAALNLHTIMQNGVYHMIAAVFFLAVALSFGGRAYKMLAGMRANVLARRSPVAFQLLWMLALSAAALAVGLVPLYGAFTAGLAVAVADDSLAGRQDRNALAGISFGFFVPVYFALVGVQLDLLHHFNPLFFLGFLVFGCAAKGASVYLGARLSRENRFMSWSLAVALNARGGPGIVLASVSYAAGIINQTFFVSLVMLSIVTSLLAGSWLDRVAVKLGAPARQHGHSQRATPRAARHHLRLRPLSHNMTAPITQRPPGPRSAGAWSPPRWRDPSYLPASPAGAARRRTGVTST